ncbi:MAG: pyruvate formate lyase family protein [Anaerolineae bacterium]|nr:pyruvate formate lyase family protein [Anaerolineae bacterium]
MTLKLSKRVICLRERAFNWQDTQKAYIGQRLYPAMKALSECRPGTPWMMKKSQMMASVIRESKPDVYEDELLVGYNFSGGDDQQWLEMTSARPDQARRSQLHNYLSTGTLTAKQIQNTLSILDNIDKYIPRDGFIPESEPLVGRAADEGLFWCYATAFNHTVIGYAQVIEKGFLALAEEVRRKLAGLTINKTGDLQSRLVLESMLVTAESAAEIGERYANHIAVLSEGIIEPERLTELTELQKILRQVPAHPARTFHEAVQSLWFAHILNTWEDGINANSIGRLDQILFPYYQRDIDAGILTREQAFELLCCLWIKLYRDYDVQQIALGGVDVAGHDATNELTYLMLDVTEALDFVRCLSIRLHKDSPVSLLRRSLELVRKGNGIPFFFNDDVLIPALVDNHIARPDARDYAAIGCVEITIPGKANPHAVSNRINLLKCLELALNNGRSMTTGEVFGPATGDPERMGSLEDVITAYEQQVTYGVHSMCRETLRCLMDLRLTAPMPYKSLLTNGCLDKGRDFNDGGALYDFHESMPMGIPNVADSLAAIDQMVFKERRLTLNELVISLKQDFPHESLRLALLNHAPKYGNDEPEVDTLAARVFRHYCELMREVSVTYQLPFFAQPFTFLWLVEAGQRTAATPDGRRRGENLAYSISPMQGRDFKGLSALINSLAKLPQHLAAGSTSAIVEIEPSLFSDENLDHLVVLLQTAIKKGVGQLQFNVVNEETLRKAQAEPEKYRNLAVRVSGFSQKFCLLSKEIQDHIIARTKHNQL